MKEERNIITMDGQGNISLPSDIGATAMTEREICELFGVIAPTVRAGIKALCKSGVLSVYGKYSINSLVYWVTYVHNVVYSFYRSMLSLIHI